MGIRSTLTVGREAALRRLREIVNEDVASYQLAEMLEALTESWNFDIVDDLGEDDHMLEHIVADEHVFGGPMTLDEFSSRGSDDD